MNGVAQNSPVLPDVAFEPGRKRGAVLYESLVSFGTETGPRRLWSDSVTDLLEATIVDVTLLLPVGWQAGPYEVQALDGNLGSRTEETGKGEI